ncbi:DUF2304 domain-containing protein [Eubacterium sp. BL-380-WT-2B]|uniref:DUF2304 domain-containing protein n=1 Tax=Eubacterium sp. BL-380-WT-2B TaxID=2605785 RepID=UPI0012B3C6DF|nr:DUF2304 domain-containing protein [Eubacterium sp. BL-380-WT-2B]MSS92741.1 DUF2304 domain-containing protein [Eubacterium sp. BL-380-WT-2B]
MNITLRIFLAIAIIFFLVIIINLLRKQKLNLQYSLIWLFSVFALLLLITFPEIVYWISRIVGIETPVNVVYVIEAMFVLLILLSITIIISDLNEKNRKTIQALAILEKRVRELEIEKNRSKIIKKG